MASLKRQVQDILDELSSHGWKIRYTGNHYVVSPPAPTKCTPVVIAASPSDWRSMQNIKAHVRHRGYKLTCI